jgi:RimJ/RimL family protein N-acetyltransferase
MHNPFLIGTRVYLRPVEAGDAIHFTRYLNDPEVRRNLRRDWPLTPAEEDRWVAGLGGSREEIVLGICLRDGDRLIGATGLRQFDWLARHASFGIVIGEKDCWDQGYGTEATRRIIEHAFEALNLERIWLEVYEFNARGIHVYEKLGFVTEGRLRRHIYRDSRHWDVVVMGLLRAEWTREKTPSG